MTLKIIPSSKNKKILNVISNFSESSRAGMRHGLFEMGSLFREKLRADMLKPKSGNVYFIRRGKRGRRYRHVASAPGESPAVISGDLRDSVDFLVHSSSEMEFGYKNSVDYGKYLEDGTKNIKPRPGLNNIITAYQIRALNKLAEEINKRTFK
jgi:hypothetical protein